MNELALFAGAGGGLLASELLGWRTACAVEINAYCTSILIQRQNEGFLQPFPIWNDIRTFDGKPWKKHIDVVSGGFPCQSFSTATHGKSTAVDLWPEMFRIIQEVRSPFVFGENVSFKAIGAAARQCEDIGYRTEVLHLSSAQLGAADNRSRFWFLAYNDVRGQLLSLINVQTSGMPELIPSIWKEGPENGRQLINLTKEKKGRSRPSPSRLLGSEMAGRTGRLLSPSPDSGRMDGRLANRMERHDAFGNGQVPAVAAAAFRILAYEAAKTIKGENNGRNVT